MQEDIATAEQALAVYRQAVKLHDSGNFSDTIALCNKLVDLGQHHHMLNRTGINLYNVRKLRAISYCKAGQFVEAEQELKDLQTVLRRYGARGSNLKYWELVARYKGDEKKAMDEWIKK